MNSTMVSSGYVRAGANANKDWRSRWATPLPIPEPAVVLSLPGEIISPTDIGVPLYSKADMARQQGFTGNQCSNCNSMQMKVSGHCEVCSECGTTTGCS